MPKINKAQTIRELLVKNPSVTWTEVEAAFEKLGTTVTQAQFYQVRTAEQGGGTKKKKATRKPRRKTTTRQPVAAKTSAPATTTSGKAAITFRDNLFQFLTQGQRDLGKDTVQAAVNSVFDQIG
jgi:hypothetical protein